MNGRLCPHNRFKVFGVEKEDSEDVIYYIVECTICHHYAGDVDQEAAISKLDAGDVSREPAQQVSDDCQH